MVEMVDFLQCPLCKQVLHFKQGEDLNQKIDEHISAGCPKESTAKLRTNNCSFDKCKNAEVMPIICHECQRNFCVRHRLPQDHQCPSLTWKEIHREKTRDTQSKLQSTIDALKGNKSSTAQRILQMRQKMKSIGNENIPLEKRFYLEIIYPSESEVEPKPMFFNSQWTVSKGRSKGSVEMTYTLKKSINESIENMAFDISHDF